ncbi:MAG: GNAT family N-acetyltransferase [Firmicutes bacterium]|nr:GNAT family N-acetyltransferase [Bacillota bacterium]
MEINYPTGTQEARLRTLWRLAFGDPEELIAGFFADGYSPRRCRCAAENGNVAAALYWFDAEFRGQKFAYLYAVATHPDFRNRGLCRTLMADTAACLTERGYDGALLMPQDSGLREMYGRMGFRDCCTVSEFACGAGEAVALRPVSRTEFAALRRKYLPPDGVIQEGSNLSYLERFAAFYAGADFLLAAAPNGDSLTGMELLGSAGAAPGILGALGVSHGRFRTPGTALPGAMFRPLRADADAPGYFGLIFD